MLNGMSVIQRKLLTVSNTFANTPPTGLKKYDWQALVILSTVIDEKAKPIFGIDDIKEMMEKEGIESKRDQQQFLDDFMLEQDTYFLSFDEFFSYYGNEDALNRTVKKDILSAVEGLHNRKLYTSSTEDIFRGITWFDTVEVNYKEKHIMFILGRISKRLLMGLDRDFLQMMAESVTEFSGKHSTPVFLYMKSKLHKGTDAYSWTENLSDFQERFGHDKVSSYAKDFNSYYKRVLSIAEKDSLKSKDIAFKIQGKAKRGRKITHVACKVWRIGNIYIPKSGKGKQEELFADERRAKWKKFEDEMTVKQQEAFSFLKSVEINYGFLLDEVFTHKCLTHEVIIGYEEVFLRMLWNRFLSYTKANKKAGAFVSWWRRGRLTEGDHYWATIESVINYKKNISDKESDERQAMSGMSHVKWGITKKKMTTTKGKKNANSTPTIKQVKHLLTTSESKAVFVYDRFIKDYPKEFKGIKADLSVRLLEVYGEGGAQSPAFQKQLERMLPNHCEQWFNKNLQ